MLPRGDTPSNGMTRPRTGRLFPGRPRLELLDLQKNGIEGVKVKLVNQLDYCRWEVVVFGPPQTLYDGAYIRLLLTFPDKYPFEPPLLLSVTKLWHPNVFEDGEVCVVHGVEWCVTWTARVLLQSFISLLNDPNTLSSANLYAAKMYDRWRASNGKNSKYEELVRMYVNTSRVEAIRDGVNVPRTIEEYVATGRRSVEVPVVAQMVNCGSHHSVSNLS